MTKLELGFRFILIIFSRLLAYSMSDILKEYKVRFKYNWILFIVKSVLILLSFYMLWAVYQVKVYSIMTYIEPIGWFCISMISNMIFWGVQLNKSNRKIYWRLVVGSALIDDFSFIMLWILIFMQRDMFSWAGL